MIEKETTKGESGGIIPLPHTATFCIAQITYG